MSDMTTSASWQALWAHRTAHGDMRMSALFEADSGRAERMYLSHMGLSLDYSKNRVTTETMRLLFGLAQTRGLATWRNRMVEGEAINNTENRAVLHMALRDRQGHLIANKAVHDVVSSELARMKEFVAQVLDGRWCAHDDKPIKHVVNIGIGGSHLGPQAAYEALAPTCRTRVHVHYVSNMDAHDMDRVLRRIEPEATIFIIASKTFTTAETMANAKRAQAFLAQQLGPDADIQCHFVAITGNADRAQAFGIKPDAVFSMWDWVGGRYSVWSAIGLSLALGIGWENFEQLLDGGHAMDRHFVDAPLERNMPVIMGLIGLWNSNFLGAKTHAVLPYDQRLDRFIDHLQQLDMESNGKRVNREGAPVDYATGPVVWGRAGTNGQHAFYQLVHQGTQLVPADFIAVLKPDHDAMDQHRHVLANVLAQTKALMLGRTEKTARACMLDADIEGDKAAWLAPHRSFPGNIPTNTLLLDRLDPFHLGQLLALYEHKVFVQGIVWNINSFDQWGVELGKELAASVYEDLGQTGKGGVHDASTNHLVSVIRAALAGQSGT